MKNLTFVFLFVLVLFSCKQEAGKTTETKTAKTDSTAIVVEQALAEQMAAFYTGSLPCSDCDGIETILTLNADEKRTFALEEQHKGKENKTVEKKGTWSVNGDMVTLNAESGLMKYQLTEEGLVSLNADGTKRDSVSAKQYLLRKVLGE